MISLVFRRFDAQTPTVPRKEGWRAITVDVPEEVRKDLKQYTLDHDTTIQAVLYDFVTELLYQSPQEPIPEKSAPEGG